MEEGSNTWQSALDLFEAAMDQPPEARSDFIAKACGDNLELLRQVEQLLAAHQEPSPLDKPAAALAFDLLERFSTETSESPEGGQQVGPYRLLRELGRGGMGSVYLAARDDGEYEDQVAIKLIQPGLAGDKVVDRFRRERQILATLKHPNIARLLDGGITRGGLPYFVMEHVEGESIDAYCDRLGLSIRQRIELFLGVCDAVQAAHRRLVVHCDLKPDNILVTAEGVPKLLDFGIARLLGPEGPDALTLTAAGRPMTPRYASPEQVEEGILTTASDIYSLGVVLYEVLSGRSPYRLRSDSRREVEDAVLQQEPERPSTAVSKTGETTDDEGECSPQEVGRRRGVTVRDLERQLAGDLDNIVRKTLAKEPERRYGSVTELAGDLRRHLRDQPVTARPPTWGYLLGKFLRRQWLAVMAATLILASLLGGILTTSYQARRAKTRGETAESTVRFLESILEGADPDRLGSQSPTFLEVLEEGLRKIDDELDDQPAVQARIKRIVGAVYRRLEDEKAEALLTAALEIHRREGSPEELAASLLEVGLYELGQGQREDAEEKIQEAVGILADLYGETPHEATALALNHLGLLSKEMGLLEEAESAHRRALRIRLEVLGPRHFDITTSQQNLAVILRLQEKWEEAEELYREVLHIRTEMEGPAHYGIATTLTNLAVVLRNRASVSDPEEAARLRSEAADLNRRAIDMLRGLGLEDHTRSGIANYNLASLLLSQEQYSEAEGPFQEAVRIFALPGNNPRTLALVRSRLGLILRRLGKLEEAEPVLRDALVYMRSALPESTRTAETILSYGLVLRDLARCHRAVEVLREAREVFLENEREDKMAEVDAALASGCAEAATK